jgi:hypothetical protein
VSRQFKFHYNVTRITGTLHEDLCTFMVTSRWILLRMRNIWDKYCRENQGTHLYSNSFFPKTVSLMRKCGKVWYSETGHSRQYNMAHALCMLDDWRYKHTHTRTHTHTHRTRNNFYFHGNKCYANAPECYLYIHCTPCTVTKEKQKKSLIQYISVIITWW